MTPDTVSTITAPSTSTTTLNPTTSAGESGRGGGRGRGRGYRGSGRGRGGRHTRAPFKSATTQVSICKGDATEMNGHVFQCNNESRDPRQFNKTLKALGQYALTKLKYGDDLRPIYHELMDATLDEPEDISDDNAKSKFKFKK